VSWLLGKGWRINRGEGPRGESWAYDARQQRLARPMGSETSTIKEMGHWYSFWQTMAVFIFLIGYTTSRGGGGPP
jgi:hypothetical protein